MIVLLNRPRIHVLLRWKRRSAGLRCFKAFNHFLWIGPGFQPQIDLRIRFRVQQVIALVLRIGHAEVLRDIRAHWMNLKREIAAFYRVQKIEADGKFGA